MLERNYFVRYCIFIGLWNVVHFTNCHSGSLAVVADLTRCVLIILRIEQKIRKNHCEWKAIFIFASLHWDNSLNLCTLYVYKVVQTVVMSQ